MDQECAQWKRKAERLEKLARINAVINSSLDIDTALCKILFAATEVMEAEAASIMVEDEATGDLLCHQATGTVGSQVCEEFRIPRGKGIAGWVAEHKETVRVEDAYQDARFSPDMDSKTGFRTRSLLCIPIEAHDTFIGVAQVINKNPQSEEEPGFFDEEDERLFSLFCQQAALAIDNARMHRTQLGKQRLDWDLNTAREIQKSFLPHTQPSLPGVDLHMHYEPAFQVGGDLYDYFCTDRGHLAMVIGDVSGKGVSAALYTARFISDLRALAQEGYSIGALVERLNEYQCERSRFGMFITLIFGILDLSTLRLEFVYAGHPPLLHYRPGDFCVELKGKSSPPLGIFKDTEYAPNEIYLQPGDMVLWYTDGIIEVVNQDGALNGIKWLKENIQSLGVSGNELSQKIVDQVHRYGGQGGFYDDIALLILETRKEERE